LTVRDTFAVSACKLSLWVAATDLGVVELILVEAALSFAFIRSILALGFTITKRFFADALLVGTLELVLETTTSGIIVELVFLEAALLVTFI